jgi:hypothetical protein
MKKSPDDLEAITGAIRGPVAKFGVREIPFPLSLRFCPVFHLNLFSAAWQQV